MSTLRIRVLDDFQIADHPLPGGIQPRHFHLLTSARKKSLDLMKQWLTPSQLEQYEHERAFEVRGSHGGRYRIDDTMVSFNVRKIKRHFLRNPTLGAKFCFQPEGVWSQGDVMLAQKIMLEQNEPEALRIANRRR